MKRKADDIVDTVHNTNGTSSPATSARMGLVKKPKVYYDDRLFFRRLPLSVTFQKVKDAIGKDKISALQWITDQQHGGFYGSCIVQVVNVDVKKEVLTSKNGIQIENKKIKVAEVFKKDDEDMF